METIKDEIRSIFESQHYNVEEMITALEDLKKWCEQSIKDIEEHEY